MKTKVKISVMLMAMFIGTLAVNGQTARRGESKNKATSANKTYNKPTRNSKPATLNRASATRQQQARPARNVQQQRQAPVRSVQKESNRHVSTTNRHNPRSDYKKPATTVHVGKTYNDPKPSNRHVNTGNRTGNTVHYRDNRGHGYSHKQYYYPSSRVKIHVHPKTYRGNYRVLYYPVNHEIIWTRSLHRHYMHLYPGYTLRYHYGYRIQTMSVWDARYNIGEIARVYGRVYATWYNHDTDNLLLFFGGEYPYQEFTMIIPGRVARRYSWKPERYFLGQHVAATGLVTSFEGKAEMIIKKRSQINVF